MKHFIHLPPSESRQSGMSVNIIQWFLNKTYLDKKAHRGISSIQKKKNIKENSDSLGSAQIVATQTCWPLFIGW